MDTQRLSGGLKALVCIWAPYGSTTASPQSGDMAMSAHLVSALETDCSYTVAFGKATGSPSVRKKDEWVLRRGMASMSSESDQESGRWSSRTSDVDSTHCESDGSESDGYQGDDTDSDQSCGGNYWDEDHSDADNVYAGRESDDGDSD